MVLPLIGRFAATTAFRSAFKAPNTPKTENWKLVRKTKNIDKRINQLNRALPKLVEHGYKVFKAETPIDTGNARRNTKRVRNQIRGDYPYANRLNNGWSKQSPDGMTTPTIESIRKEVKKI